MPTRLIYMNKIACFDLDGVSVHEHDPFSVRLVRRQGQEIRSAVDDFFAREFGKVMVGQAGLHESIEPYLERFHWQGDVDSLLQFWFEGEKSPNNNVLSLVSDVRARGIAAYVVTDNPAERVAAYWDNFLGEYFDGRFVSGETGLKKGSKRLWDFIAKKACVMKHDIFFTDDDEENVGIAASAGIHAVLFTGTESLKQSLYDFLDLV